MRNKINYWWVLVFLIFVSCVNKNESKLFDEGVSRELAEMRSTQIDSVHYTLNFSIPENLKDSIPAKLQLDLQVKSLDYPLVLDFKPNRNQDIYLSVNGKEAPTNYQQEHILISSDLLTLGLNKIEIDFIAGEQSLNRNNDYLFTLLVPDRARTLFPCFDQPDIKAKYSLTLETPNDWKAVSAAALKQKLNDEKRSTYVFKTSDLMSTYLFSFVAGRFSELVESKDAFTMHLLHHETDDAKVKASVQTIFDLHRLSIDFLENYTEHKFPFQKLDIASIYSHPYGGMEHVGAIQYRQPSIFLDESATQTQVLSRAKVIAHETAHMWFGDWVTMQWFDDVWLKEVFANFMADKIVNPAFPEINHLLKFNTTHYPRAYGIDRTRGANPIRQDLANLNNAGSLYGNIIYNKAPIMMRQLEALLGEEEFRNGLVEYIEAFQNSNAKWSDLIEIFDQKTTLDLHQWSLNWVNSSGRPIFTSTIESNEARIKKFKIQQKAEDHTDKVWPQIFKIDLVYPDSVHTVTVYSTAKEIELKDVIGLKAPDRIIYNSDGFGYGVFPIDQKDLESIAKIKSENTRGATYINLFENVLNKSITVEDGMQTFEMGLKTESNELILQTLTQYVQQLFWKYIAENDRQEVAVRLESMLYDRLLRNDSNGIKKTLFGLYKNIAFQSKGLDRLYRVWTKELTIGGLILNDDDYTSLAFQLALFDHRKADEILALAGNAINDPNKKARFEFILPALVSNAEERQAYFASFENEENRAIESWVLTACHYLHHPLRQKTAAVNLELSLNLLDEIQRTGDIFFPKNWLDVTIGQYTSSEAYQLVEDFLAKNPALNAQLRLKILQSTDDLYRMNNY